MSSHFLVSGPVGYLTWLLVVRDLFGSYRRTLLGVFWNLLKPLANLIVFSLVFSLFLRVPTGDVPYAAFVLSALVPWQSFSDGIMRGTSSLLANVAIISKSEIDRVVFPLASAIYTTLQLCLGLLLVVGLLALVWGLWSPVLYWLPMLIGVQFLLVLGITLLTSVVAVYFRDLAVMMPLALQVGLFLHPIAYPISIVPEAYRPLYLLNPAVGLFQGYRAVLVEHAAPDIVSLTVLLGLAIVSLVLGGFLFKRLVRRVPDVV